MDATKAGGIVNTLKAGLPGMFPGLHVEVSRPSHDEHEVTVRVQVCEKTPSGVDTREARAFQENAGRFGLDVGLLNAEFKCCLVSADDTTFKIVGYNQRGKKYPIMLEGKGTKRRYKVSVERLKELLSYQPTMRTNAEGESHETAPPV